MKTIFSQVNIDTDDLEVPVTRLNDVDGGKIGDIMGVVFAVAGSVALLVIVIAGIQFMLSRGDPQKSAKARNAIIYAAIGLVVAVLAFSIVQFTAESV